ncbi:MAG: carbohydrate ABC transporter permease [Oscillospiraceae bacterium]|nr:carbohydrate ABC transporter permease [Oscillospiraceae bacterium]
MQITAARRNRIKITGDRIVLNVISYIALSLFALACVIPFYLIIVSSFTSERAILTHGFSMWIREFSIEGFEIILTNPALIARAYANTIGVTLVGTAVAVFLATMAGYVLQRRDFAWRNPIMFIFYFTMLFNGGLTPYYILCVRYLGFTNSYHALLLPGMFSVWNMIIAKNYMRTIPDEIVESAKIDGAGEFRIFIQLILPLATPLLATLGLFTALGYWNNWMDAMLFIRDRDMYTLQYFLQNMLRSIQALRVVAEMSGLVVPVMPAENMKMAMTLIVTGPIIFAYPFAQKYFLKGLTIGAIKG